MGLAYLPDGSRMDYQDYLKSPAWKAKKVDRLAFDNWQCAICHMPLDGMYETHHLNYLRLGREDIKIDLITLCRACHQKFHEVWSKNSYWEKSEADHWRFYDLIETAKFCAEYHNQDYWFGGDLNLCNLDVIGQCIDEYLSYHNILTSPIAIEDVRLYFRNARYEVIIVSAERGESIDSLLDRKFGEKRTKGGNPQRAEARRFATKHKLPAMKRISKENKDIIEITKKVNQIFMKEKF